MGGGVKPTYRGNILLKKDKNGNKKRIHFLFGLNVKFKGKDSMVIVHEPFPKFRRCKLVLGSNGSIIIGSSNYRVSKLKVFANADYSKCYIGKNCFFFSDSEIILRPEPYKIVSIGNNCMAGKNLQIRTSDAHSVIDLSNNKPMNYGKNVIIGNHVWLGYDVTVLKGVRIADNNVIGTKSVVTKDCMDNCCVYAGIPAKKVKTNVSWDIENPFEHE